MSNDANNISPQDNEERKLALLNSLNDDLNHEEESGEDPFAQDAAEGLKQIKEEDVQSIVHSLNTSLAKQIHKKKRKKRPIPDQTTTYLIIITLLVLIIVAYIVVRKMNQT
jgi:hypothetical protein